MRYAGRMVVVGRLTHCCLYPKKPSKTRRASSSMTGPLTATARRPLASTSRQERRSVHRADLADQTHLRVAGAVTGDATALVPLTSRTRGDTLRLRESRPDVHVSSSWTSAVVAACWMHRALNRCARCGDFGNATFSFFVSLVSQASGDDLRRRRTTGDRLETVLTAISTIRAHCDPTCGTGRAMACRPVGACPPERLDRGWMANRGARHTRVSEMRLPASGVSAQSRMIRVTAAGTSGDTHLRRLGDRVLRSSG
jgi:hypothetical protein